MKVIVVEGTCLVCSKGTRRYLATAVWSVWRQRCSHAFKGEALITKPETRKKRRRCSLSEIIPTKPKPVHEAAGDCLVQ